MRDIMELGKDGDGDSDDDDDELDLIKQIIEDPGAEQEIELPKTPWPGDLPDTEP